MKDLSHVALAWSEEKVDDFVISASATVEVGSPLANPHVAGVTLYLEVEESDQLDQEEEETETDEVDDYSPTFSWTVSIDEETAGFGAATLAYGEAPDLEHAKDYCWSAVIDYLRADGYSDQEIAASVH